MPRIESQIDKRLRIEAEALAKAYQAEAQNIPTVSGKLSELCKYIWAGSIATFFALLTASSGTRAFEFYSANKTIVFAAAILGSFAFLFDYLQNLSALTHAKRLVRWIEQTDPIRIDQFNNMVASTWTRANFAFFCLKNLCAVLAAIAMMTGISIFFLRGL
jgi:hypothetical protein